MEPAFVFAIFVTTNFQVYKGTSVSNLCAIAVETPLWVVAGTFDADDGELSVDSADRTLDERIEKCSTVGVPKTLQI